MTEKRKNVVTVAVVNTKGGVGKTTPSVNISADIADGKRHVLLVDLATNISDGNTHLGS